jgi:hypothetical protein
MFHPTPFIISPPPNLLITYPHLQSLVQELSQYYSKNSMTEEHLKTIGLALWEVLGIDTTLPSKNLMIKCHGNAVDNLPWECLYHPKLGFLAKRLDYTLSRYIKNHQNNQNPKSIFKKILPPKGPLNILLITALPEKLSQQLGPLEIELEQQIVYKALIPFISAGWVHFYAPNDGRFSTYVKLLQPQTWHLVILNGHGLVRPPSPLAPLPKGNQPSPLAPLPKGEGNCQKLVKANSAFRFLENENTSAFFMFESEMGESEFVTANALAQAFQNTNVQCVIVAACQSAQFLDENHFISPILQAGVPHVVGMREALIDRAGTVFVRALCVALAQQARIDVAVQTGRQAMTQLLKDNERWCNVQEKTLSNDPSIGQWCLPVLISHDPTQPIVDWDFGPKPRFPNPIGSQIAMPKVFIGRRRELRTLEEALCSGKIRRLLIRGTGGLGKTALAGRLAITLAQQGYRIFALKAGEERDLISTLEQALNFAHPPSLWEGVRGRATWEEVRRRGLKTFTQQRWLLWLDGLEKRQNPHNHLFTDITLQTILETLSEYQNENLRILLTSRWTIPQSLDFYDYRILQPKFHDFSRYLKQLGLNYDFSERLKIYHSLGGNFQGVQLLQSLPTYDDTTHLNKNLAMVQRYLSAYLSPCVCCVCCVFAFMAL